MGVQRLRRRAYTEGNAGSVLVAELRSCMPCCEAKTLKKKKPFLVRENVKKQTKNKTKQKNTLGNRYHHTNLFDNPHLMRGCMV